MKYRDKEWLQEQFNEYKTVTNVANKTGYPRTCITRYAKKYGIYESLYTRNKCNDINENYFKVIDTSEKAYFLGLIMADGNMYLKNNKLQFSIKLKSTDSDIIYKLSKAVGFDESKLKFHKGTRNGTETIGIELKTYNQVFCENLLNKGIVPNKTGKESFPAIRDNLKKDFIRGFIDGDGWIGKDRNRIGVASMSLDIIDQISNHLKEFLKINININKDKNLFRFDIYDKFKVLKILNYLYYNDCISLERKHELANNTKSRILNLFGSL